MGKKKWALSVFMILVSIGILASMFLNYISVDLSSIIKGNVPFGETVNAISELFGKVKEAGTIEMSGLQVLKTVMKSSRVLDRAGEQLLLFLRLLVLVPYAAAILVILFSLFRRVWSYILTLLFSAAGLGFTLFGTLYLIPSKISSIASKTAGNAVGNIVSGLAGESNNPITNAITEIAADAAADLASGKVEEAASVAKVRSLMFKGVGPAWWIAAVGLGVLILLSVVGIILAVRKGAVKVGADHRAGFICAKGDLPGYEVPLEAGDSIFFGSDPSSASMVIKEPGVSPRHLRLSFLPQKGMYCISIYPGSVVYYKGKQLKEGETLLPAGAQIALGTRECTVDLI